MLTRKQLWRKCITKKMNLEECNNNLKINFIPIKYKEKKKSVKFNNIVDVILIPINKYHSI